MEFNEYRLGELVEIYNAKRIPLSTAQRNLQTEKKYPYYGAQGIIDYVEDYIFNGKYLLIAEDGENLRSRNEDIALIANGKFWVNNHAHILKNNSKSNLEVLKFTLNIMDLSGYLTGSAQPKLNKKNLEAISIKLPNIETQNKIGSLIELFEEKIRTNNAIVKNLEEITDFIFKRWFIDFEFPNEQGLPYCSSGGEMVKSELGEVPNGWSIKKLKDIYENHDRKRKPLSKMERAGMEKIYPYYGAISLVDYVDDYRFEGTYILLSEDGANILNPDGSPSLQYVCGKFWVNNHAHVMTGKNKYSTEFIYNLLRNCNFESIVTGAVQPKISQTNLNNFKVVVPPENLLKKYDEVAIPIFKQIINLYKEIESLTNIRDSLLPKLLSGEIEIPDESVVESS